MFTHLPNEKRLDCPLSKQENPVRISPWLNFQKDVYLRLQVWGMEPVARELLDVPEKLRIAPRYVNEIGETEHFGCFRLSSLPESEVVKTVGENLLFLFKLRIKKNYGFDPRYQIL